MSLAIEAGQYLKLKNPNADVTVRDLESIEETIVIPTRRYPNSDDSGTL